MTDYNPTSYQQVLLLAKRKGFEPVIDRPDKLVARKGGDLGPWIDVQFGKTGSVTRAHAGGAGYVYDWKQDKLREVLAWLNTARDAE